MNGCWVGVSGEGLLCGLAFLKKEPAILVEYPPLGCFWPAGADFSTIVLFLSPPLISGSPENEGEITGVVVSSCIVEYDVLRRTDGGEATDGTDPPHGVQSGVISPTDGRRLPVVGVTAGA